MKNCRITVMRKAFYPDLAARHENPLPDPCPLEEGQVFVTRGWEMPEGFCASAWQDLYPYVFALAQGGGDFFDGWMRDPYSAMISCNDGFRPVSFLIEALEPEPPEKA